MWNEEVNSIEEEPNDEAKKFFQLLKAAEDPLYEESKMSRLEMTSRIITLKCEYNLSHRCVDGFASLLNEALRDGNQMGRTFYDTKKILKGLELPHDKIHTCLKVACCSRKATYMLKNVMYVEMIDTRRHSRANLSLQRVYSTFRSHQGCKGCMQRRTF